MERRERVQDREELLLDRLLVAELLVQHVGHADGRRGLVVEVDERLEERLERVRPALLVVFDRKPQPQVE